jgi:hypothetical protein
VLLRREEYELLASHAAGLEALHSPVKLSFVGLTIHADSGTNADRTGSQRVFFAHHPVNVNVE